MKKSELEKENVALKRKNAKLREAIIEVRQVARDCIHKGAQINHVWIIEKVTETIACISVEVV